MRNIYAYKNIYKLQKEVYAEKIKADSFSQETVSFASTKYIKTI